MSNQNQSLVNRAEAKVAKRQELAALAREIDATAAGAVELFQGAGSFEKEIQLASAMRDLRELLTPEVMAPIMSLMNSPLGFVTDRDPARPTRDGEVKPYSVEVVRDCVIESKLRGFHTIGNEFNIIAGRFYAAKNGFRRKLTDGKSFPGLRDFRDSYDVPRLMGDKGAIVKCRASWTMNGKPETFEAEFAIRVNSMMGADAITGKAERKLCKRVHDLIAGTNTPEGEAGEDDLKPANATVEPKVGKPFAESDEIPGAETPPRNSTPEPATEAGNVAASPQGEGSAAPAGATTQAATVSPASHPKVSTIRKQLSRAELTEGDAVTQVHKMFPNTEGCNSLDDVQQLAPNVINSMIRGWDTFVSAIRKAKGIDPAPK